MEHTVDERGDVAEWRGGAGGGDGVPGTSIAMRHQTRVVESRAAFPLCVRV